MPTKKVESNYLTRGLIADAIRSTSGNLTQAAVKLGITRYDLQARVNSSPALARVVTDAIESLVDLAEEGARVLVGERDSGMIRFVLESQGAKRGWVKRKEIEISGPDDTPIDIKLKLQRKFAKYFDGGGKA